LKRKEWKKTRTVSKVSKETADAVEQHGYYTFKMKVTIAEATGDLAARIRAAAKKKKRQDRTGLPRR
jgi:hypothetical protein